MNDETPLQRFADDIKKLVAVAQLENAIEQLRNFLADRDPQLLDTVTLISMQFRTLTREEAEGSRTGEQLRVERTRIAKSINWIADEIPKRIKPEMSPLSLSFKSESTESREPRDLAFEAILGINNLRQLSWISQGINAARSVCRILTPGGVGSGFLIAPGLLMTNNHVISKPETASKSWAEFNYEQGPEGKTLPSVRYRVDGSTSTFHTSDKNVLDYTLVRLVPDAAKPPLGGWGFLTVNPNADPISTEHVSIIQHPNGGLKQIALTANWVVDIKPPFLSYTTDTMRGSSGSPVFNDSWHVIAIHHAGPPESATGKNLRNEGVLMSAIRPDAGMHWPGDAA